MQASQVPLVVKNPPANAGEARDVCLIPGLGRSLGEGNVNPLQYSCLENAMDRGAWWVIVHGVTKSWTRLSDFHFVTFSSVQSLSRVQLFATPRTAAHQASRSITNSWSLLKLMFFESVMPSNYLILYCPLLCPPSIFPSIRVFSNESAL